MELLIHENLTYLNQINSPLANGMGALIVAYNYTGGIIPGSTRTCDTKLSCLQLMCTTKQIINCDKMLIVPRPGSWSKSNKCNLTVNASINDLHDNWHSIYLMILVSNIIALFIIFISWIMRIFNCSNWILAAGFTLPTHILSIICIPLSISELIELSSLDYVIPGGHYYNKVHNIVLLVTYILLYLFLLSNFIYNCVVHIKQISKSDTHLQNL